MTRRIGKRTREAAIHCLEQCASDLRVTVVAREHERCEALIILGLTIGARLNQFLRDLLDQQNSDHLTTPRRANAARLHGVERAQSFFKVTPWCRHYVCALNAILFTARVE